MNLIYSSVAKITPLLVSTIHRSFRSCCLCVRSLHRFVAFRPFLSLLLMILSEICTNKFLEVIYYKTGGEFVMTEEDPGFAAIFAPYPSAYLSTIGAIFDSVIFFFSDFASSNQFWLLLVEKIVGSSLLLICAGAIVDPRNGNVPLSHMALYMGLAVIGLGISFSLNCGVPINPARDLSPRLFTYLIGWGPQVFRY